MKPPSQQRGKLSLGMVSTAVAVSDHQSLVCAHPRLAQRKHMSNAGRYANKQQAFSRMGFQWASLASADHCPGRAVSARTSGQFLPVPEPEVLSAGRVRSLSLRSSVHETTGQAQDMLATSESRRARECDAASTSKEASVQRRAL